VIVKELQAADIHPQEISIHEDNAWPDAVDYMAMVVDSVGLKIFGEEAFPENAEVLHKDI